MIYHVDVSANAEQNLRDYYLHAAKHAPHTAARWLVRFQESLKGLATLPERWPLATEARLYTLPLRQMLFAKCSSAKGEVSSEYSSLFKMTR